MENETNDTKSDKAKELENQYQQYFKPAARPTRPGRENFAQPAGLRIVDSVTTYGAYEEPI
jgi:hypothetical protein